MFPALTSAFDPPVFVPDSFLPFGYFHLLLLDYKPMAAADVQILSTRTQCYKTIKERQCSIRSIRLQPDFHFVLCLVSV